MFPYLLRHTRATELYIHSDIKDKVASKFLGHGKDMRDVYAHLSNKDVKEALGKTVYKLDEMPEEKKHELELRIEELEKAHIKRELDIVTTVAKLKETLTREWRRQDKTQADFKEIKKGHNRLLKMAGGRQKLTLPKKQN